MRKVLQLLLQVIIFQVLLYIVASLKNGTGCSVTGLVASCIPTNWYVTLYIMLYCLSPFLNILIRNMKQNYFKEFVFILILGFSIQPTIIEILEGVRNTTLMGASTIGILGAEWGYTIVTFVMIYFIAAYMRLYISEISVKWNVAIYFFAALGLFIWKVIELKLGRSIAAGHYQNPFLVVVCINTFYLFKGFRMQNKAVNILSKGCFTVYILHATLIRYLLIDKSVINGNTFVFICQLMLRVIIIFSICTVIGLIYVNIEKKIFDFIESKKKFYIIE